jgi:hypothetical protein
MRESGATAAAAAAAAAAAMLLSLQVCLSNQLKDILEADRARIASGRAPLYLVSQYTYGLNSSMRTFAGGTHFVVVVCMHVRDTLAPWDLLTQLNSTVQGVYHAWLASVSADLQVIQCICMQLVVCGLCGFNNRQRVVMHHVCALPCHGCAAAGGPLSFVLPVAGIRSSIVQLEAEADSMRFVVNTSPGKILGEL